MSARPRRVGRVAVAAALVLLAGPERAPAFAPGGAAAEGDVLVASEGSSERLLVNLGGVLLGAASPEGAGAADGLLLLVRGARDSAGARQLLRLRLEPKPQLERLADGLDGRLDALVAVELATSDGAPSQPHLLASGPGHLVDLGALADLAAESSAPIVARPLLVEPRFDPASLAPPIVRRGIERGLAAVAPGQLLLWQAGTGAGESREVELPVAMSRTSGGLRLSSPPVAVITPIDGAWESAATTFLVGPERVGNVRLRALHLAASLDSGAVANEPTELWASLPGPEEVAQSWPFKIDGVPVVVVRTQGADELNLFERQRLRVLPLASDRTRAGAPPTLAAELDSKRWHRTAVALGDVDGDGHADLLAAFPEGLSGTDLVVQWWRGAGGGKFDPKAHRSDLKEAPEGWALVASRGAGIGGADRSGLLLVGDRHIEWRPFVANGKSAVAGRAELTGAIPPQGATGEPREGAKGKKAVKVTAGPEGESSEVVNEESAPEPLGGAELDGRPGLELLAVQASGSGDERLIVLRRRPE